MRKKDAFQKKKVHMNIGGIRGKVIVFATNMFFMAGMYFGANISTGAEIPVNVITEELQGRIGEITKYSDEIPLKSDKDPKEPLPQGPIIVTIDTIVVNLSGSNLRRYLKAKVILEVRNEEARGKLETRTIQVKDRLISILSSKTIDDIDSVEGREYIKREIKDSVDVILNMEKAVLQVYFEDFVVQ
ncbi:flagellar protein FliL [Candidatus Kuenenia stuttgartiensis]|jgi:flagellar basal body-associated protein FliL|nr:MULTISPECIES: flagellar basal body-associated FliL family protein [Kuenenia]MBE7548928.1 flagellar basal body-associated FliL family protein [Planctomycetia bacterium]MBZ0192440.1 flagellar basal body-associated FliL family protein [Candidatus Kuenenia stuttgartiensis]MCF6153026.1 hypothetical protein [Candidatus Kuenenia stuttgartiensis]MCL4727964.1 flagellar basal body-associated FliL family protein [Candidatus Kuenenia stuttgartiensis]MCZ7622446.1 flagellar basal body-associated FliL fam